MSDKKSRPIPSRTAWLAVMLQLHAADPAYNVPSRRY